jgi:hypothetical protein
MKNLTHSLYLIGMDLDGRIFREEFKYKPMDAQSARPFRASIRHSVVNSQELPRGGASHGIVESIE